MLVTMNNGVRIAVIISRHVASLFPGHRLHGILLLRQPFDRLGIKESPAPSFLCEKQHAPHSALDIIRSKAQGSRFPDRFEA